MVGLPFALLAYEQLLVKQLHFWPRPKVFLASSRVPEPLVLEREMELFLENGVPRVQKFHEVPLQSELRTSGPDHTGLVSILVSGETEGSGLPAAE